MYLTSGNKNATRECRCGRANEAGFACKRAPNDKCMAQYQARISGPLLDRFDLSIEVGAVTAADLVLPPPTEGSREIGMRVARARAIQAARYESLGLPYRTNAATTAPVIEEVARPDEAGTKLLRDASEKYRLTARGFHRVMKVARTLADLDGAEKVGRIHLAEALSYRAMVPG